MVACIAKQNGGTGGRCSMGLLLGGVLLWPVAIVLPISVAMILYGVIPLGSPAIVFAIEGQWPTLFVIIPTVMTAISLLTIRIYSAAKGDLLNRIAMPGSHLFCILITTYMCEILCMVLVASLRGNIDLLGLVALGVSYVITFAGILLSEKSTAPVCAEEPASPLFDQPLSRSPLPLQEGEYLSNLQGEQQQPHHAKAILGPYFKMMLVVFVHFLWLIAFIVGYREVRWMSAVQPLLNFGMAVMVFIFKKILLSITDPFPLETAMLLSSLWLQSLSDIFQAMAYPSIVNPITYAYIWLIHLCANLAYLIFLTDIWFRFRVWIKGVIGCRCYNMPLAQEEDSPSDHGHSWNHPAYIRRQLRFFFWRVFSGVWAIIFYICLSSILRLGPNRRYYPFSSDPYLLPGDSDNRNIFALNWTDYGNSLLFVAVDSGALVLAGLFGLLYAKRRFPEDLRKILFWRQDMDEDYEGGSPLISGKPVTETRMRDTVSRYLELVVAVLLYNALISVMILQYHMKIWWAFEAEAAHATPSESVN